MGHSINVPLKPGLTGQSYLDISKRILPGIIEKYSPEAIVIQAGCDGLAHDPLISTGDLDSKTTRNQGEGWNVDIHSFAALVEYILSFNKPSLVLGGGGYLNTNAAKCWTYVTSRILKKDIPEEIPEHPLYGEYLPDTQLSIPPSNMPDKNTLEYINSVVREVETCIHSI
jgi:histone deacetylase 8